MKVRHLTRYLNCGGGLQRHLQVVKSGGQETFGLLDALPASFRNGISIQRSSSRFRKIWKQEFSALEPVDIAVYHNGWGMDLLSGVDNARLRVCWIHSDFPNLDVFIRHFAPYADAFVSVHPGMQARIAAENPWIPSRRNRSLCCPVVVSPQVLQQRHHPRKKPVIGYIGRLEKRQKRVERLLPFWKYLKEKGIPAELEIMGTGPMEKWLRKKFKDDPDVRFLGNMDRNQVWAALANWRYVFFPSSFEGLPLALVEAVAAGVMPIYPSFHGEAEPLYSVNPQLLYPQGEMSTAAEIVIQLEKEYPQKHRIFLERSKPFLKQHHPQQFAEQNDALLEDFMGLRDRPGRLPSSYLLWAPIWYYNRFYRFLTLGRFW